jgi:acetolactate decarboxylase
MRQHVFSVLPIVVIVYILFHSPVTACSRISDGQDLPDKELLFQVSTMKALLDGKFDGEMTFGELRGHGDFGIGVMNKLDGKMIALDGEFYQIKVLGGAFPISDFMKTPFAVVTFFDVDESLVIGDGPVSFAAMTRKLNNLIVNKEIFYAIRIDGEFRMVKIRSVPPQNKPYRRLNKVLRTGQKIRNLENITGTMVGFWYPRYVGGINVPGYHFHFITKDRSKGGHVLDCRLINGEVRIDRITQIHIELQQKQARLK